MIKIGNRSNLSIHVAGYPGYGYRVSDRYWRIFVSGVAWHGPVVFNRRQRMLIRMLGGVMKASPDELACDIFQSRITPFMADCDQREKIVVKLGDHSFPLRRRTKKNGRFQQWLNVDADLVENLQQNRDGLSVLPYQVQITTDHSDAHSETQSCLLPRTGISIVSDIDDTIKVSDVLNKRELLHNTFLREFQSVAGMAETYRHWADLGSRFHYVSSSPWQLFSSLNQLRTEHGFPVGTMHLRNFRLRDQLLKKVIIRRQGKRVAISRLIGHLPDRKYVLVGDSGEKDPEIYRKVCKKHPDSIAGIFIRQLQGRPMEPERLRRLKTFLPNGVCEVFADGDDLREKAEALFETAGA